VEKEKEEEGEEESIPFQSSVLFDRKRGFLYKILRFKN
jgi:hypothetical protein